MHLIMYERSILPLVYHLPTVSDEMLEGPYRHHRPQTYVHNTTKTNLGILKASVIEVIHGRGAAEVSDLIT